MPRGREPAGAGAGDLSRMPNGANAAFYQQEALSFPEVAAATVVARPRGVGTVDVFLATAAGLPTADCWNRWRPIWRNAAKSPWMFR